MNTTRESFVGRALRPVLLAATAAALAGPAAAQVDAAFCGPLNNAYGPYDYRHQRAQLGIVEKFHFNPDVEMLRRGQSGTLGGDLDYTLRASPNHHRALAALIRWSERVKMPQANTLPRPFECYFERAIRFQKEDLVARMLYAKFLATNRRENDAIAELGRVAAMAGDNPLTHYNVGMLYMELKAYDKALAQSHRAAALGLEGKPLREALQQAGQWRDPPPPAAAAAPAATPAAAPPTPEPAASEPAR